MRCGLEIGDIVTSKSMKWPWQTHFIADPNDLEKVPQEMHNDLPKLASCIGLIGLTVLLGIRKKGGLKHFAQLLSNERYYYIRKYYLVSVANFEYIFNFGYSTGKISKH